MTLHVDVLELVLLPPPLRRGVQDGDAAIHEGAEAHYTCITAHANEQTVIVRAAESHAAVEDLATEQHTTADAGQRHQRVMTKLAVIWRVVREAFAVESA